MDGRGQEGATLAMSGRACVSKGPDCNLFGHAAPATTSSTKSRSPRAVRKAMRLGQASSVCLQHLVGLESRQLPRLFDSIGTRLMPDVRIAANLQSSSAGGLDSSEGAQGQLANVGLGGMQ